MEIDALLSWLVLIAALGCGLVAGIFFAFSSFVMRALAILPASQGIAAMQSINVVVLNRWFFGAFFGTAVVCLLAILAALLWWRMPESIYLVAGGLLYLVGTILVTIVCNVPRNQSLASFPADDPESAGAWARYVDGWTFWNHVRTAAALAAALAFGLALST